MTSYCTCLNFTIFANSPLIYFIRLFLGFYKPFSISTKKTCCNITFAFDISMPTKEITFRSFLTIMPYKSIG